MPDRRSFRTLLNQERDNLALVIGNGINIHGAGNRNSWERLLVQIAHHCAVDVPSVPKGTALTEFYDVLEMKRSNPTAADDDQAATLNLQAEFCRLMERWEPLRHHHTIMNWAVRHDVPVLTTNFEEVLSDAAGCDFIKPTMPKSMKALLGRPDLLRRFRVRAGKTGESFPLRASSWSRPTHSAGDAPPQRSAWAEPSTTYSGSNTSPPVSRIWRQSSQSRSVSTPAGGR